MTGRHTSMGPLRNGSLSGRGYGLGLVEYGEPHAWVDVDGPLTDWDCGGCYTKSLAVGKPKWRLLMMTCTERPSDLSRSATCSEMTDAATDWNRGGKLQLRVRNYGHV